MIHKLEMGKFHGMLVEIFPFWMTLQRKPSCTNLARFKEFQGFRNKPRICKKEIAKKTACKGHSLIPTENSDHERFSHAGYTTNGHVTTPISAGSRCTRPKKGPRACLPCPSHQNGRHQPRGSTKQSQSSQKEKQNHTPPSWSGTNVPRAESATPTAQPPLPGLPVAAPRSVWMLRLWTRRALRQCKTEQQGPLKRGPHKWWFSLGFRLVSLKNHTRKGTSIKIRTQLLNPWVGPLHSRDKSSLLQSNLAKYAVCSTESKQVHTSGQPSCQIQTIQMEATGSSSRVPG